MASNNTHPQCTSFSSRNLIPVSSRPRTSQKPQLQHDHVFKGVPTRAFQHQQNMQGQQFEALRPQVPQHTSEDQWPVKPPNFEFPGIGQLQLQQNVRPSQQLQQALPQKNEGPQRQHPRPVQPSGKRRLEPYRQNGAPYSGQPTCMKTQNMKLPRTKAPASKLSNTIPNTKPAQPQHHQAAATPRALQHAANLTDLYIEMLVIKLSPSPWDPHCIICTLGGKSDLHPDGACLPFDSRGYGEHVKALFCRHCGKEGHMTFLCESLFPEKRRWFSEIEEQDEGWVERLENCVNIAEEEGVGGQIQLKSHVSEIKPEQDRTTSEKGFKKQFESRAPEEPQLDGINNKEDVEIRLERALLEFNRRN